jgi:hypothetical protein
VAPEAISDEARSGSDEAVRRIREESRRRIERQKGWRAFSSLCALASLAGGISLAAMNARDARIHRLAAVEMEADEALRHAERAAAERAAERGERAERAERAEKEQWARVAVACAKKTAALAAIDEGAHQALERARTEQEQMNVRLDAIARATMVIEDATAEGCEE